MTITIALASLSRPDVAVPCPGKVKFSDVMARLSRLPASVVGPNPAKLARRVGRALTAVRLAQTGDAADFGPDDLSAAEPRVKSIGQELERIIAIAAEVSEVPTQSDGRLSGPLHAGDDPLLLAGLRRGLKIDEASAVAKVTRYLASLLPEPCKNKGGRPPAVDAVYMLVRVMVAYLYEHGMPVSAKWNLTKDRKGATGRRADDECLPVSEDTELLCRLADVFNLQVDNVRLRCALNTYLGQLLREQRGPVPADIPDVLLRHSETSAKSSVGAT